MEVESTRLPIYCKVDDQQTEGFVLRHDLDSAERTKRALKILGALWGSALLTIFIPIVHFIVPPLLILAGCFFSVTTFMEKSEIIQGEFTCPNCKKVNRLDQQSEEYPKTVRCEGCSFTLNLERHA